MLEIVVSALFRKQLKRCRKRGWDLDRLAEVVSMLQRGERLPERYRDHALVGSRSGLRDCHIQPDWVLIYEVREEDVVLLLLETGSHSDLNM